MARIARDRTRGNSRSDRYLEPSGCPALRERLAFGAPGILSPPGIENRSNKHRAIFGIELARTPWRRQLWHTPTACAAAALPRTAHACGPRCARCTAQRMSPALAARGSELAIFLEPAREKRPCSHRDRSGATTFLERARENLMKLEPQIESQVGFLEPAREKRSSPPPRSVRKESNSFLVHFHPDPPKGPLVDEPIFLQSSQKRHTWKLLCWGRP